MKTISKIAIACFGILLLGAAAHASVTSQHQDGTATLKVTGTDRPEIQVDFSADYPANYLVKIYFNRDNALPGCSGSLVTTLSGGAYRYRSIVKNDLMGDGTVYFSACVYYTAPDGSFAPYLVRVITDDTHAYGID